MAINKTTEETKDEIRRKSAQFLPNNPSACGMKADDIRKAFYAPVTAAAGSILTEMDRIVNEANTELGAKDAALANETLAREKADSTLQKGIDANATDIDDLRIELNSRMTPLENTSNKHTTHITAIETAIKGNSRSYVVETFSALPDVLTGRWEIGDTVYYADELITGDNLLIVEQGVPDFWFEATTDTAREAETYTYTDENGNETVHTLRVLGYDNGGTQVGLLHILESDYTVIDGYSKSASRSATEAAESASEAYHSEEAAETNARAAEAHKARAAESAAKAEAAAKRAESAEASVAVTAEDAVKHIEDMAETALDVVQTTGRGETRVMSQRAVTDAIKAATEFDETYDEDITESLSQSVGVHWTTGGITENMSDAYACTELISVQEGDRFKISALYGYYTVLIAEFDGDTMIGYNGQVNGGTVVAADYEYTVPRGVDGIRVSTRDRSRHPIRVKRVHNESVKRSVEKCEETLLGTVCFAQNTVEGGNFASTEGFSAIGGRLSVSDGIGRITADRTNVKVGVEVHFGEYATGDKVFFKMRMRTPMGQGGSAMQNRVWAVINHNTSTGLKSAVGKEVTTLDFEDYYGVVEFDGASSSRPVVNFYAQFNGTVNIPDGAVVELAGLMSVNLTNTFGKGKEPNAEAFYSLLGGFEGKYFDGKANLLGADANIHRIYSDFKSTALTKDITVTVGEGGDFRTLKKAIEYLSCFYPVYKHGGINCCIKILAGTVINEQIYASQIDLQYITIIAEAGANNTEVINIDGTSYTMVIVDVDATGFGHTANAHDSRGNSPFLAGENAAKLPTIGCVFRLLPNTVEEGKTVCGMLCNRGSAGVVLAASGFDGFNDGVIANNESSITIREGISRNMTRWGVHARHNGEVSARSCVCTSCGIAACADRIADLDVREAVLDGSTVAIECNNLSRVNANGGHAQNCGADGGYVVSVSGGGFANCASLDSAGYVGTLFNADPNKLTAYGIIFS